MDNSNGLSPIGYWNSNCGKINKQGGSFDGGFPMGRAHEVDPDKLVEGLDMGLERLSGLMVGFYKF
jgi:hypothetical protein